MANTEYRAVAATVGLRIRKARERAGLSQDRLARQIKTSRRNVLRWEGGYNMPRADHIERIADATGRTADYFLGDDEEEEEALSADLARVLHDLVGAAVREALNERAEERADGAGSAVA